MRYTSDDQKTIRQILGDSLRSIESELSLIRESLETMDKRGVWGVESRAWLKYELSALSESLDDLESRLVSLEKHASWERWVIRQVMFFGLAVIVGLSVYWIV